MRLAIRLPKIEIRRAGFSKALEPEWRTLHGVADGIRPELRRLFLRSAAATAGGTVLAQVERALSMGDFRAAEEAIPWEMLTVELGLAAEIIRRTFERSANAAAKFLPQRIQTQLRFDVVNPRAIEFIQTQTAELVTGVTAESRAAIRGIIRRGFEDGIPPRKMARQIQAVIGITDRQAISVDNFRRQLVADGLSVDRALDSSQKFATRFVRQRAEIIARTETINAANRGQLELWRQAADNGLIDPSRTVRRWITTEDDRVCPFCMPMDGQEIAFEGEFTSGITPTGRQLEPTITPTLHPRCRCAMELVVR